MARSEKMLALGSLAVDDAIAIEEDVLNTLKGSLHRLGSETRAIVDAVTFMITKNPRAIGSPDP